MGGYKIGLRHLIAFSAALHFVCYSSLGVSSSFQSRTDPPRNTTPYCASLLCTLDKRYSDAHCNRSVLSASYGHGKSTATILEHTPHLPALYLPANISRNLLMTKADLSSPPHRVC